MSVAHLRETSRPRAGRRFLPTHELALLQPAVDACSGLPGAHRGLLVVQEMTGPIGIPDLTAVVGDPCLLARRLSADVPALLHEVDVAVVSAAHAHRPLTAPSLATALGWPEATVRRRLGHLLRSGALVPAGRGTFVRPESLRPVGRVYAVEAKVSDWRRALLQVRTYGVWADGYVLVMGALSARAVAAVTSEVSLDGGGLVVDGRWLRRPTIRRLPLARRLWASEHVVAALRTGYQPSPAP